MSSKTNRIAVVVAAIALAACNGPAGGNGSSQTAGGSSQSVGGGSSQAAGGGGSGVDASTLNPCTMLSASDIQAAVGWTVDAGKLQSNPNNSDCEWSDPADDSHGVSLQVANYDDALWQAGASTANAKPLSGFGDAAYEGWPTAAALSIKIKNYAVTLGVVDFAKTSDQIHAEDETLAKLVLPKL